MPDTLENKAENLRKRLVKKIRANEPKRLKRQAIRLRALRYAFSPKELGNGIEEKDVRKRLKISKNLEESYLLYLQELKKNPTKKMVFPWDSPLRRFLFILIFWLPRFLRWSLWSLFILFVINYLPGPTQHIVEISAAHLIYKTAPIQRMPVKLESYAHSANIVDANGLILKSYGKREVTTKISSEVKKALLACEDHYFLPHAKNQWYVNFFLIHAGVSWFNLAGAVIDTLQGNTRGASTLVMQNAKKILGNTERTIRAKLEEIIISYLLVARFGKEKNLDFYINTVPVGSNIYGYPAGAKNYFKKDLSELNFQQLVTIGSFIPNHNRQLAFYEISSGKNFEELSPNRVRHAKAAMQKVNLALGWLLRQEEITDEQYQQWLLTDEESIHRIGLRDFSSPLYGEEEWSSWNTIKEVCSRSYLIDGRWVDGVSLILDVKGDVVIETEVDLTLAAHVKESITDFLGSNEYRSILRERNLNSWEKDLDRFRQRKVEAPFSDFDGFMERLFTDINVGVILINQWGEIVAYAGGKEFYSNNDSSGQNGGKKKNPIIIDLMNRKATITVSSTIKPVVGYYTMVAKNVDLSATFPDSPLEYKYSKSADREIWLPRNWYGYDAKGKGLNRYWGRKYTLLDAQVLSINTIFARLYRQWDIRNSMLIGFNRIGLDYNREDAKYWPFGIGASSVPVQQWLGVYNAFLDGKYRKPTFVRRILVNDKVVYDRQSDPEMSPVDLFDAKRERKDEMYALYEVCQRGTGKSVKSEFKYYKNLISGKTGTAPNGKSSLFISHFNPYQNRMRHSEHTVTMIVAFMTNSGGYQNVGNSTEGPTKIAGRIYNYLFEKELERMMDEELEEAKHINVHFLNNHVYWANVNRYMDRLLNDKCGKEYIYENILGVDGYREALRQILNTRTKIYTGRDDLFDQLVDYYCMQDKIVKLNSSK